jgi:hypothetical protein
LLLSPAEVPTVAPDSFGLNPRETKLDPISTGIRPAKRRLAGEKEANMISTDFETRQLLVREHRDQLARDMRLARRTPAERGSFLATWRALGRAHDRIRSLPRAKPKPSDIQRPQEV